MKAAFFWETMLVVIYAKILHYSLIPTIYEKFKSVVLSSPNKSLETCMQVSFAKLKELKQFWSTFIG